MLKGHAVIELTDVNTGKKQVYEEDNLVTNAIARQLNLLRNAAAMTTNTIECFNDVDLFPIYNTMTNGILLFQDPLEEDANNMVLPAPTINPLVGYASNGAYSGADTKRGGANVNESELLDNGYKYVWDFATSQANGQISALALTSSICGATPYYSGNGLEKCYYSKGCTDNEFNRNLIAFNFDTGIAKQLFMKNATTLLIRDMDFHLVTIGMFSSPLNPTDQNTVEVDLTSDTITLDVNCQWIDGEDGYYYSLYANNSKNVSIARLNKETLKLDEIFGLQTITLTQSVKCRTDNSNHNESAIVLNGYIYIVHGNYIHKINISNFEDITVKYQNIYSVVGEYGVSKWGKDKIVCGGLVIFEDLSVAKNKPYKSGFSSTAYENKRVFIDDSGAVYEINFYSYNTYGMRFYARSNYNYLATINNLTTPIVKTAAQTMKITYTLLEATE